MTPQFYLATVVALLVVLVVLVVLCARPRRHRRAHFAGAAAAPGAADSPDPILKKLTADCTKACPATIGSSDFCDCMGKESASGPTEGPCHILEQYVNGISQYTNCEKNTPADLLGTCAVCTIDFDCDSPEMGMYNGCLWGQCYPPCATNSDCATGSICNNTSMGNKNCRANSCTDPNDCPSGFVCKYGACAPADPPK